MIQLTQWNKRETILDKRQITERKVSRRETIGNVINFVILIVLVSVGSYFFVKQNNRRFCIVSSTASTIQHFQKNIDSIGKQTLSGWSAIYYVDQNQLTTQQLEKRNSLIQGKNNIQIVNSSNHENKNIYDAIINRCPYIDSYIILLNEDQVLFKEDSLQELLNAFQQSEYLLMAVPFFYHGSIHYPDSGIASFQRDQYFSSDQIRVDIDLIFNMSNHLRVFTKKQFLKIAQWDLLDSQQQFYKTKTSFLFSLYELSGKSISTLFQYIQSQSIQNYTRHNNRCGFLSNPLFKKYKDLKFQHIQEINEIGRKIIYQPYQLTIPKSLYYSSSYPKIFSKQNFRTPNTKTKTKQQQTQIPKKIHQIWIGDDMPQYKQKFMQKFTKLMPQFQYKLWGNEDINQTNFPLTIKYINQLLKIHKKFPYSRYSMIADLMKYEIVYHNGGFYFDTNYELFQSLENYTNYQFLCVMEQSGYQGQYIATSFFAGVVNNRYLQRILTTELLNSINMRSTQANIQTGPAYLAKAFYPEDFFDNIKIFPTRTILPFEYWVFDRRMISLRCSYSQQQQIPVIYNDFYDQTLWVGTTKILYPCNKFYPYSIGVDHFDLGGSWMHKKVDIN